MDPKTRLMELGGGYQHSAVLLAALQCGVFAALGTGTRSAAALADELSLDRRALGTVLFALAADGILDSRDDGFRIAADYLPLLLPGSPTTLANILGHHSNLMSSWVRLEGVLRSGQPAPAEADRSDPDVLRAFICGMADISRGSSEEVADKVDLSRFRRMLDVGGGPGSAAIAFARRHASLRCTVFDLEAPLAIAREEIRKADLEDRIDTRAGSYFEVELGEGFDLVYVSNIIHSMGDSETRMLLEKCWRALAPGGLLIVKEFFLDDDRVHPAHAAFFSVNMLVNTGEGKSYTLTETQRMLESIGYRDFETVPVAVASRLLLAGKPAAG